MQPQRSEVEPLRSSAPGERPVRRGTGAAPLACIHCGALIREGEWYIPAGRCAMGGVITGPHVDLYGDALEPAGEHLHCATATRGAVFSEPEEEPEGLATPDGG